MIDLETVFWKATEDRTTDDDLFEYALTFADDKLVIPYRKDGYSLTKTLEIPRDKRLVAESKNVTITTSASVGIKVTGGSTEREYAGLLGGIHLRMTDADATGIQVDGAIGYRLDNCAVTWASAANTGSVGIFIDGVSTRQTAYCQLYDCLVEKAGTGYLLDGTGPFWCNRGTMVGCHSGSATLYHYHFKNANSWRVDASAEGGSVPGFYFTDASNSNDLRIHAESTSVGWEIVSGTRNHIYGTWVSGGGFTDNGSRTVYEAAREWHAPSTEGLADGRYVLKMTSNVPSWEAE